MGLSGRKVKQRIGNDPRNLSWVDDAGRFGQAYLEKFGWDSSKGLGASGEGRTSALKATQKLDMLGIGMQHQKDPDGIAWRQNRDFENLLRRLNSEVATETPGPFHETREAGGGEEAVVVVVVDDASGDEGATKRKKGKGKKRKAREGTLEPEGLDDKKRRKKRRRELRDGDDSGGDAVQHVAPAPDATDATVSRSAPPAAVTATTATPSAAPAPVLRAPPRTHRARIIAAKRMAASNSTALAEILGIPPSSSSTPSASSPYPLSATSTSTPTPTPEAQDPLQKLTTATQSVDDYFKAKLGAKAQQPRPNWAPVAALNDDDCPPRAGLGASRSVPIEAPSDERERGGIGASSMFAAMFALGRATPYAGEGNVASVDTDAARGADGCDHGDEDDRGKSEKKRAKEERRREKEERRRKRAEARSGTATGSLDGEAADVPVGETMGEGAKRKKRRELGAPGSRLELDAPSGSGMEDGISTKKRKKRDKDRKSRKDRDPLE